MWDHVPRAIRVGVPVGVLLSFLGWAAVRWEFSGAPFTVEGTATSCRRTRPSRHIDTLTGLREVGGSYQVTIHTEIGDLGYSCSLPGSGPVLVTLKRGILTNTLSIVDVERRTLP